MPIIELLQILLFSREANTKIEANIDILDIPCTFNDSPILFYLPGEEVADNRKYAMTEECLLQLPQTVSNYCEIKLITEKNEIELAEVIGIGVSTIRR